MPKLVETYGRGKRCSLHRSIVLLAGCGGDSGPELAPIGFAFAGMKAGDWRCRLMAPHRRWGHSYATDESSE